jgi:hypothetical protein
MVSEPFTKREVLLSNLLQDILNSSHHLLNVLLQIANKLGLPAKKKKRLYESNSGYLLTFIVYMRKEHVLAIPTHSESHTQNSRSSSETL